MPESPFNSRHKPKKDLTQEQVENILAKQFSRTQTWQAVLYVLVLAVPFVLLTLWGFGDVHIVIRILVYAVLGITLMKCKEWVVARRVRKTIEAMRTV